MRKKTRAYVHWSIVYITVLAAVLLIAFLGGVKFLQFEIKDELVKSHNVTAELIDSKIAKMLTSTDTVANIITRNGQLINLIKNTNYDREYYIELMNVTSQILVALDGTEYTSDYAIYINEGKKFIHATSIFPAESFFKDYSPTQISSFEKWIMLVEKEHTFDMYATENGDLLYLKTIYENFKSKSRKIGTLIMKIPNIVLDKNFAGSIRKGTANVIIKQNDMVLYYLYEDELLKGAKNFTGKDQNVSQDGIMIFSARVGVLDVIYAVHEGNAFKRLVTCEAVIAVALFLLFIFGVLIIIPLSKWQYKPIESLVRRFGNDTEKAYKNEFEYINASIDFYENQQRLNIEKLSQYKEMALSYMLSRHILENNSLDVLSILEKCDYTFPHKYHAIVIVYIRKLNEELWSGNSKDRQLMFYAMENVCTELFNEEFSLLTLPINESFYTGIVSSEIEENLSVKLKEIYNKVEEVLKEIGVEINFLIGESFSDIREINTEYSKIATKARTPDKQHSTDLVRIWEEASNASDVRNSTRRVDEIIQYIKNNFSDSNLTMESIAQHIGLNPRYMLKIFKGQTGVLLKDYILRIRIDRAKELLLMDMTIETVAKQCGYMSSHSFIRAFKRVTGITPGEMRQRNKFEDN